MSVQYRVTRKEISPSVGNIAGISATLVGESQNEEDFVPPFDPVHFPQGAPVDGADGSTFAPGSMILMQGEGVSGAYILSPEHEWLRQFAPKEKNEFSFEVYTAGTLITHVKGIIFYVLVNGVETGYEYGHYGVELKFDAAQFDYYTITIGGIIQSINFSYMKETGQWRHAGSDCTKILSPLPSTLSNTTNFARMFLNDLDNLNDQLEYIPPNLFMNYPDAENFKSTFAYRRSLTTNVEHLFDKCKKIKNVSNCFEKCGLTGKAPELWNSEKWPDITSYSGCFRDCTGLSNYADIPAGWK